MSIVPYSLEYAKKRKFMPALVADDMKYDEDHDFATLPVNLWANWDNPGAWKFPKEVFIA